MRSAALVALAALLGVPGAVQRPGDLDPSWGRGGVARTVVTQDAARLQLSDFSVLRTQSGKIVVFARSTIARPKSWFEAIGPVVLRYTRNGELDSTFGRGGIVRGPAAYASSQPGWDAGLALPDGGLVVRVHDFDVDGGRHGVLRLLPDGRVDRSFGVRGRAVVDTGCRRGVLQVLRQPDGKLVELVRGCSEPILGATFFRLVRLHPNGRLDRSFGRSGLASVRVGRPRPLETASLLLRQPDGKLVVAGIADENGQIALARFTRDGRIDRAFGDSGVVLVPLELHTLSAVLAQAGGRLLVVGCGSGGIEQRGDVVFLRYTRRGDLDPSFAEGGMRLREDVLDRRGCGPARAARGRIVFFAEDIFRLRADGRRDTGFARDGVLENPSGEATLLQPDGKIVVAGRIKRVGSRSVFVRRHLG